MRNSRGFNTLSNEKHLKVIKDLFIIQEVGLVIYSRRYHVLIDPNLFGALMSALHSYAKVLVEGGLSSFEMENRRFTLVKREGFIFVATSSKKIKEKFVLKELNYVADKFFSIYEPEFLKNWNGDTSVYGNFEVQIQDSLRGTINKLVKAFW